MVEPATLLGSGWALAAVVMTVLWLVQRRTGNAGVVDVGWATITGGLAVWYAVFGAGDLARRLVLAGLGAAWGGRLAWHLLRDRVWGQPEEGRDVTLRRKWSPHADRSYFRFFQAQALATVALFASRGQDYRHYQRTTSPFVPWPPRHGASETEG